MPRWQTNAQGRLEQAAIELFDERGYDDTTVAAIAERAGLTERTFFRYFADKREVLFSGAQLLPETMTAALRDVPDAVAPPAAVVDALVVAADTLFGSDRYAFVARRQLVIDANPVLQERELSKLDALGASLAEVLRARGAGATSAAVVAGIGVTVFRVSFARWVGQGGRTSLADAIRACWSEVADEIAYPGPATRRRSRANAG